MSEPIYNSAGEVLYPGLAGDGAGYRGSRLVTLTPESWEEAEGAWPLMQDAPVPEAKTGYAALGSYPDNYGAAAQEAGCPAYTYATSEAMADAELALLRQAVRGKELTLPVALDMEDETLAVLKPKDLTNLAAYALEKVEKMGFYAQLYTYTSYANTHLDMARLSGRWDVWLADYTGKTPNVTFNYNAHQHTSKGAVPGISGNVDLNVTTVNYPKIIRKKGLTRLREGA